MRALYLEQFGADASAISLAEREPTEPGRGEVRVRMRLAPVHPSDFNWIRGTYHQALERTIWNQGSTPPMFDPDGTRPAKQPPFMLGVEGVGVVESAGEGLLGRMLIGRRVAVASGRDGTFGELVVTSAKQALPVPAALDDHQAAMLFVNPLTAWALVREVLDAKRGDWLLHTAAGSTLGRMVMRLCAEVGVRAIAVVRKKGSERALMDAGAHAVIATDDQDLLPAVHAITAGRGVDYVTDCVGGELGGQAIRCLTSGGRAVLYGTLADSPIMLPPRDLMMPMASVEGFFLPGWLATVSLPKKIAALRQVSRRMVTGVLASEVGSVEPLERYEVTFERAAAGGGAKHLIRFGE